MASVRRVAVARGCGQTKASTKLGRCAIRLASLSLERAETDPLLFSIETFLSSTTVYDTAAPPPCVWYAPPPRGSCSIPWGLQTRPAARLVHDGSQTAVVMAGCATSAICEPRATNLPRGELICMMKIEGHGHKFIVHGGRWGAGRPVTSGEGEGPARVTHLQKQVLISFYSL
jgi:hypothetical protein